jgi:hypothetical protein
MEEASKGAAAKARKKSGSQTTKEGPAESPKTPAATREAPAPAKAETFKAASLFDFAPGTGKSWWSRCSRIEPDTATACDIETMRTRTSLGKRTSRAQPKKSTKWLKNPSMRNGIRAKPGRSSLHFHGYLAFCQPAVGSRQLGHQHQRAWRAENFVLVAKALRLLLVSQKLCRLCRQRTSRGKRSRH